MEKSDWLLLAIGDGTIEPVQVQKLMFLFAKESDVPEDEAYSFVPYDWGPCSFDIYSDLDDLINSEVVDRYSTSRGWNCYGLTEKGRQLTAELIASADRTCLNKLGDLRNWVRGQSFRSLLRSVYERYPEYAVASRFEE